MKDLFIIYVQNGTEKRNTTGFLLKFLTRKNKNACAHISAAGIYTRRAPLPSSFIAELWMMSGPS
jgi:hypothetical protein